ncbi:energy-coupling factor transporter transmembrane protein EcfT [Acholeplasma vituli]|uniref:Energy-coupling factor transporter transmembrane protein EcfT n=1 Tax=Paracholeplasma vituli TaxID=69473 RepID=A0ABT2PTK7_9MOLU|nr:energy-coupling factor transporter transmembrane component T [Paracholeplasma vituli]MCU0104293.1 energy-coupling factor transporter transmembrane protein EcfT [Paracholeplasma vituli]
MNNITIGQYVHGDSWIYKMDPRVKIISLVLAMVITFIIPSFIMMAILLGLTILMVFTTGIPVMKMIRGMKALLFLLTFTFIIQIFNIRTGDKLLDVNMTLGWASIGAMVLIIVLYNLYKKQFKYRSTLFLVMAFSLFFVQYLLPFGEIWTYDFMIYSDGLYRTGFLLFRIMIVIILSSMLTFTTMTTDLNNGLEAVMKPLEWVKFPVAELSMMLSLTLRFIPTLLEETQKIMKAQASRGVEFSESSFKKKISQMISLLIPIFIISFKRAEDLANAMESRGYVIGEKRTKIDVMSIKYLDILTLITLLGLLVVVILMNTGVIHAL